MAEHDHARRPTASIPVSRWDRHPVAPPAGGAPAHRRRHRPATCTRRRARPGRPARPRPAPGRPGRRWRPGLRRDHLIVRPALDGQRPLAHLGEHRPRDRASRSAPRRAATMPAGRARPWPPPRRPRRRVPTAASRVARLPRRPVKVRSGRRLASWARRRADPVATSGAGGQGAERGPHQHVAGIGPLGEGGQHQSGYLELGGGGQVLGRVHGGVGIPPDHRGLHLLDEHPLAPEPVERHVEPAVPVGLHHHQRRRDTPDSLEQRGHPLGLPQGQRRAPGGQPERTGRSVTRATRSDRAPA